MKVRICPVLEAVFFKQGQGISLSGRVRGEIVFLYIKNKVLFFKSFMLYSYFQTLSKCFGENPQSPAPTFLGAVLPLRWKRIIVSFIFFYVDV